MSTEAPLPPAPPRRPRFVYVPALGPVLRVQLYFIFALVALLGATGFYLLSIRVFEVVRHETLQTVTSIWMLLAHVVAGIVLTIPFLVFCVTHLITAWNRPNRVAVRLGLAVFLLGLLGGATGFLLIRLEGLPQLTTETARWWVVYGLHVAAPVLAVLAYVQHRRAGPAIKWKWGYAWGATVVCFTAFMLVMHSFNPTKWGKTGSPEGEKYFEPARSRTFDGLFISEKALMMDEYCMKCHQDVYTDHLHSVHKFSSFNNPAYLFSVRETRRAAGVRASRWCAGCHDPVPFFTGKFDDPQYDDVNDPTSQAGVTCVVCHSITHVNSRSGNGDYTIDEPQHYPFAYSENTFLQWVNNQLVKAKPDFHKKTFLKPVHKSEEFCSTCHKVGLPQEVNHYKEFLRGQNHNDSFLLSGVSGHGARSFYYPPKAKGDCNICHMPLEKSDDFASRDFDKSGERKRHSHKFASSNIGLHAIKDHIYSKQALKDAADFLVNGPDGKSPTLRVDLFGLKQLNPDRVTGAVALLALVGPGSPRWAAPLAAELLIDRGVDAPLLGDAPLRPNLPVLQPGASYLVETIIRTLNMGHHFTQGTVDSNEVWVELIARGAKSGRVLGRNGGLSGDEEGVVDENAHFINVLMLDRHGNRIDRRNPQNIFTPLYNHQIPPGAGQVVHYRLDLPRALNEPVELSVRVRYRKFDYPYMEYVYGKGKVPKLPIVDLASDRVTLPVTATPADERAELGKQRSPIAPPWQRWNDYGIGCFLEGGPQGKEGGELGAAEHAFRKLLTPEYQATPAPAHGWLNLARVYLAYGSERLDDAREALIQAREHKAPWQTVAWFNGLVNVQNVNLDEAVKQFEQILDPANRDPVRGFDFTYDYIVINELGKTQFRLAQAATDPAARDSRLRQAITRFEKTLTLDAEDVTAHEFLGKSYARLGGTRTPTLKLPEKRTTAEESLLGQVKQLTSVEAARALAHALGGLQQKDERLRPAVLIQAHRDALDACTRSESLETRLALAPVVTQLDGLLLQTIPGLTQTFADARAPRTDRIAASDELVLVLAQLNRRLPQEDVATALIPLVSWPSPGLPMNLALLGTADRGHLQGPLPAPRLLVLYAARPALHALAQSDDAELRAAAAQTLGAMHLVMHGIFRPDDSAADTAVRRYRERFPAAARASQRIVIYELRSEGR